MDMCKHWIFITPADGCVHSGGDCVCVCVYKAHSLIDQVVSQCNRSFCLVVVCKMTEKSTGGRAAGAGRAGVWVDEADQGSSNLNQNTIQ